MVNSIIKLKTIFTTSSLVILFQIVCNAQGYDSLYVKKYYNKSNLGLYQNYNNHSIFISQSFYKDSANTSLQAVAESKLDLGLNFSNESYSFSLNLISSLNKESDRKPNPSAVNVILSLIKRNKLVEIGANWFKGYYENNSKNFIPNFTDTSVYYDYGNLKTSNLFLNQITFKNKDRFSYSAVFKGTEQQKKSATSFVNFFTSNYNKTSSDNAIIPDFYGSVYEKYGKLNRLSNFYMSGGIGYSGTLVLGKSFFTNLTLMGGPGLQYQHRSFLNNLQDEHKLHFIFHSDLRFSIGLNFKNFFIVSNTTFTLKSYSMSKVGITSGHLMNNLSLVYRFKRKGRIF